MYQGTPRYVLEGMGRKIAAEIDFDPEARPVRIWERETTWSYAIEAPCRTPKHYCGGI